MQIQYIFAKKNCSMPFQKRDRDELTMLLVTSLQFRLFILCVCVLVAETVCTHTQIGPGEIPSLSFHSNSFTMIKF